jgi:hypothetical protein
VAGVLLVYTFVNLMGSRALTADQLALTLSQVIRTMFYTTNGIFGGPISVCAKFIVVFIIFGAFLERTGIANFFISLANSRPAQPPVVLPRWPSSPPPCAAWCPVLRGQYRHHRFRHHPHDEKDRIQR